MDMMRGEKDLSSQTSCWVPQTPVKPNSTTQRPICSQGEGNQLGYGFDSDDMNKGWEGYGGLGVANRFPVEFEGSGHLNFGELMALADSAAAWRTDSVDLNGTGPTNPIFDTHFGTSSSNSWNMGSTGREMFGSCAPAAASYRNGVPFLYDLNSPTTALTDMNLGGNIPFQFAPVTPDQSGKSQNYQNNSIHTNLNQIPAQERVEVGNEVANMTNQVQNAVSTEQQQVQNAVSTGLQEDHNPDFDLNKTPQQKPRRRKHRPKVVIEGKAKKSPKPPKTPAPKENPTGKRKYVRKNPHNKTPSKPVSDIASGSSDPKASQETTTSCKRALNFDFEGQVQEEFPLYGTKHRGNAQSPVENRCDRVISQSVVQLGQGMEAVVEKTQVGIAHDLNRANKSFLENYLSMPQAQASSPSIPNKTHLEPGSWKPCGQSEMPCEGRVLSGDSQTVPRSPNYSNCSSSASVVEGEHAKRLKRGPLYVTEPDRTNVIGGYFNSLSKYASIIPESVSEKTITSSIRFSIVQKRKRSQERYNATTSSILNVATPAVNGGKPAMASPPSNARADVSTSGSICGAPALQLNIGSIQTVGVPGMDAQSCQQKTPGCNIAPVEKVRKPRKTSKHLPTIPSPPNNARADVSTSGSICGAPALQLNIGSIQTVGVPGMDAQSCQQKTPGCNIAPVEKVRKPRKTSKHLPTIPSPPSNARADVSTSGSICGAPALQLNIGSIQTVGVPGMDAQSCQQKTPGCNIAPVEKVRKPRKTSKHLPTIPVGPATTYGEMQVYKMSSHPQTSMEGMLMEHRRRMISKKRMKRNPSSVYTDAMQKQIPSVDEIAEYLKLLDINRESNGVMFQDLRALVPYNRRYGEQNALVLYQKDGTMVPFEGPFDPIRKRKPRPKVDLDDETTRVWRLLLENINNEGIDGTDEEKAKWWEEERRVFRGRADSFIARMHLVQGDRRFSPWKGSVVDSVVGVFLTQNVSDHLSSSAFMSLAARFPLKSDNENSCFEEPSVIIEEPEECPEQLDYQRTSVELHERVCSTEKEAEDSNEILGSISDGVRSTGNSKCQSPETAEISQISTAGKEMVQPTEPVENLLGEKVMDDMLSSQDSSVSFVESSIAQSTDPSSVSSSSLVELLRAEHLRGRKSRETEIGSLYKEASECCGKTQDKDASDKSTTSLRPMMPPNNCPGSFDLFAEASRSSDLSKKGQQNCPSEQSEVTAESVGHATLVESTSLIRNLKNAEHHAAESSLTEHRHPATGQAINGTHSDISRRKSSKTVKPKVNPIDWDGLRVQAQQEKGKRAKTANTLDSLDWEAVRCANVNEIADAIKERGMNNMLAERIQAFLNRLVEKHGGIDLEWLRDVPPDKAKEYLLSIRGLGLKSVECVRLLTLHHLAFPVDTNVGRIAVRLGWVPLQPLPESLQLHLLELYPVMESIQKYLWPRLCKLDQRTLYELHYQMITFGKVFCTKSKPNCNACPMRGECRHFASAFASARLALPGPAEKSIVTTSDGKATNQNGANVPTPSQPPLPLPLPPQAGDEQVKAHNENSNRELIVEVATTPFSSVEVPATPAAPSVEMPASPGPIIEVPASPEPSVIHVLDSDIEDAFAEDPDEIPLIRLNIEELTQNLQNYMQHNMELQEGDMNRALVALTPEAASLPTPKLKNVSRLRTEHQVYELPDSHPLLEGMERRDRDDPCSYLLAIWTPGETPTSIQPPEERCRRQESGELCESSTCFSCNSIREANSQIVRGTILIPCRTAMRGSFPLNGTYFQVNEVFADHASSIRPIEVPRQWIWNLPRRTVYFGTSVTSIFKGLSTESIQLCFWRGFVCVRGFDMQSRAPRPLLARLHFTASRLKETTAKGKAAAQNQE